MLYVISILWGVAVGLLAWYCFTVAQQITYVTLADGRKQERKLPLIFRVLLPLAPNFANLLMKPAFSIVRKNTARKIISSGFEGLINDSEFLSLKLLMPLALGPAWICFIFAAAAASPESLVYKSQLFLYLLGILYLFIYPDAWLNKMLKARHRSIQRSLPFVMDLLTLSVEAGMDFMTALQRNVERRFIDPLAEELIRVIREIQIGKTRREALRDMSTRVDMQDLRLVVNALVQADELGVSIGQILRIQAEQIRQRRFERAEKLANEAPVKMLFPLLFFIFPAVFLVLLGPIIVKIMQSGF